MWLLRKSYFPPFITKNHWIILKILFWPPKATCVIPPFDKKSCLTKRMLCFWPSRYEMNLPGMKRPLKPIPVFQQKKGESQKRFFNRMHRQVQVGHNNLSPDSSRIQVFTLWLCNFRMFSSERSTKRNSTLRCTMIRKPAKQWSKIAPKMTWAHYQHKGVSLIS